MALDLLLAWAKIHEKPPGQLTAPAGEATYTPPPQSLAGENSPWTATLQLCFLQSPLGAPSPVLVNESAEGQPVPPAGGEVLNVNLGVTEKEKQPLLNQGGLG